MTGLQRNIGDNTRAGIVLMILTTMVFAAQDGISRHLAAQYNVYMVVMIRYWFFAVFVVAVAARSKGGFVANVRTTQPALQIFRGVLLALEICVTVLAFVALGLVEAHALFAVYPLMIAGLAALTLGERVGWRRWSAIAAGFLGLVVILQPGVRVFAPEASLAIIAAVMFALYGILTRLVARRDSATTSFFWTGIGGAGAMTLIGVWFWQPMSGTDWIWMGALSLTGVTGHFLLIKTYSLAEASAVQPFAYFQLVFASAIGVALFGETLRLTTVGGALIIIGAGLFAFWREAVSKRSTRVADPL